MRDDQRIDERVTSGVMNTTLNDRSTAVSDARQTAPALTLSTATYLSASSDFRMASMRLRLAPKSPEPIRDAERTAM